MLTVYGIETRNIAEQEGDYMLQQCLPFTVLKQNIERAKGLGSLNELQQCLPFTVLKL